MPTLDLTEPFAPETTVDDLLAIPVKDIVFARKLVKRRLTDRGNDFQYSVQTISGQAVQTTYTRPPKHSVSAHQAHQRFEARLVDRRFTTFTDNLQSQLGFFKASIVADGSHTSPLCDDTVINNALVESYRPYCKMGTFMSGIMVKTDDSYLYVNGGVFDHYIERLCEAGLNPKINPLAALDEARALADVVRAEALIVSAQALLHERQAILAAGRAEITENASMLRHRLEAIANLTKPANLHLRFSFPN